VVNLTARLSGDYIEKMTKKNGGQYLTSGEAGNYFGVRPNVIYSFMKRGLIQKAGKKSPSGLVMFRLKDLILLSEKIQEEDKTGNFTEDGDPIPENTPVEPVCKEEPIFSPKPFTPPPPPGAPPKPLPAIAEPYVPSPKMRSTNMSQDLLKGIGVLEFSKWFVSHVSAQETLKVSGEELDHMMETDAVMFLKYGPTEEVLIYKESLDSVLATIPDIVEIAPEVRFLLWRLMRKTGKTPDALVHDGIMRLFNETL